MKKINSKQKGERTKLEFANFLAVRFIDLGKQIGVSEEWPRQFAFWNTTRDEFINIGDYFIWASWDEFQENFVNSLHIHAFTLERFESLCPAWVFETKGWKEYEET